MARKRQIDPEYPFEQEIAQLSIPVRYFYILAWCHMDDANGVLPYDLFKLKGQIFPTDNVDIRAIIQELIDQRRLFPFEANGKRWLWCPTMLKHQSIKHPSKKKYPDPPKELRKDYRSTTVVLPQSRVELSRVELNKEQLEAAKLLKEVSQEGFNIHQLINRVKKQLKWPKDQQFPTEVLIVVCKQYLRDKAKIKNKWAWFIKVIQQESARFFAKKEIEVSAQYKKDTFSFKEILEKMK